MSRLRHSDAISDGTLTRERSQNRAVCRISAWKATHGRTEERKGYNCTKGLLPPQYVGAKYIGLLLQLSAGSLFEAKVKNVLFSIRLSATNFSNTYQANV